MVSCEGKKRWEPCERAENIAFYERLNTTWISCRNTYSKCAFYGGRNAKLLFIGVETQNPKIGLAYEKWQWIFGITGHVVSKNATSQYYSSNKIILLHASLHFWVCKSRKNVFSLNEVWIFLIDSWNIATTNNNNNNNNKISSKSNNNNQ